MTTSYSMGGMQPPSQTSQGLAQIKSERYSFVNKDFVKNIAYLNQATDSLAMWAQTAQRGIDEAGQNPIDQIQSIFADVMVLLAGGEPTGIDLGDLKYLIIAIGSMFGINPDTPFPLNIIEAVKNLFEQYIMPLPQLSDLIFDAIIAWAEELGFSEEAIDAIEEFSVAVVDFFNGIDAVFGWLGDILSSIFDLFGFGSGFLTLGGLLDWWDEADGLVQELIHEPQDMIVNLLSKLAVIIFKTLTWLVNTINPAHLLGLTGFDSIGPQLVPSVSDSDADWVLGSDPNMAWVWDNTIGHGSGTGCFKTNGYAIDKRVLQHDYKECHPEEVYALSGFVKWDGIPADNNNYGPCVVFYDGMQEVDQLEADALDGHGTSGDWAQHKANITVPDGVDKFRAGAYIKSGINTGIIWVDDISFTKNTGGEGVVDMFGQIPVVGPLIDMLAPDSGATGTTGLGGIFSDFFGLLGPVEGIGTGNVSISDNAIDIPILGPLLNNLPNFLNQVVQFLAEVPDIAIEIINTIIGIIMEIPDLLIGIMETVIAFIAKVPDVLTKIITTILNCIATIPDIVIRIIDVFVGWIKELPAAAALFVTSILNFISTMPELIEHVITDIVEWINSIPGLIQKLVNAFIGWINELPELINELLNAFIQWLQMVPEIAGAFINTFIKLLQEAPEIAQALILAAVAIIEAAPQILDAVVDAILHWITHGTGLNFGSWGNILGNLFGGSGGSTSSTSSFGGGLLGSFMESLFGWGTNVQGTISSVGAGQISPPPSAGGGSGGSSNLLLDGSFGSSASFAPGSGWTQTGSGVAGAAGVTAGSGSQSLISNPISVYPNQTVGVSASASWTGLGGESAQLAANPISANVNLYAQGGSGAVGSSSLPTPGEFLASVPVSSTGGLWSSPGQIIANSTEHPNADEEGWVDFSDTYVIPAQVGGKDVAYAALALTITHEANQGEILFKYPKLEKPEAMHPAAVSGLPEVTDAIGGKENTVATDIETRLAGISPDDGTIDWIYTPATKTLADNIVNGLAGWDDPDWALADAQSLLITQKASTVATYNAITNMQNTIANLQAKVAALSPPAINPQFWGDDFERYSLTDLGTDWSISTSGTGNGILCTSDSHNADIINGSGTYYFTAIWDGSTSVTYTDYQTFSQVFGTAGKGGWNCLIGRANADLTYMVRYIIIGMEWYLQYISNGTPTAITSGTLPARPGAMTLVCGNKETSAPTNYEVWADRALLWSGTNAGPSYGATYRKGGFGSGVIGGIKPCAVNYWEGHDTQ